MLYNIDLHIHSSASLCFKSNGIAQNKINAEIIKEAKEKNLSLIAITDHYSVRDYAEIRMLGAREKINVLPGIELSVKTHLPEKVSLLVIFNEQITSNEIESEVLAKLDVPKESYGNGSFLIEQKIPEILSILKNFNCIIISSHQDKNPSRSSFIPNLIDYGITFFDLRNPEKKEEFINNYKKYNIIPLTFSDAHEISKIGKYYMTLDLANNSYNEFKKYFLS